MNTWKQTAVMAIAFMMSCPAVAQETDADIDAKIVEAERRLLENEARRAEAARAMEESRRERERMRADSLREMERVRAELERVMQDENIEVEVRMRVAEESLAEAAQHVAELSRRQLPRVAHIERIVRAGGGPVLGVTIGTDSGDEPVAGVTIRGVSPGGAAAEAGLRAGDVITAVNGESLTADNDDRANEILLDFMQGVEEGDELTIEYLRNGKSMQADIVPRASPNVFAFEFDGSDFTVPDAPFAPRVQQFRNYVWVSDGKGLGDMELVPLTERLGSYFGTDRGLLVVRAPGNEELQLQDGDVIQSIDGREPQSVNHAMRILGSYQSGETVRIEIMRDRRKQTITVEVPENLRGNVVTPAPPFPVSVPAPVEVPDVEVVPGAPVAPGEAERI